MGAPAGLCSRLRPRQVLAVLSTRPIPLAALALAVLAVACRPSAGEAEAVKDVARQIVEAISERDGEAYYALFSRRCRQLAAQRHFFRLDTVPALEKVGGKNAVLRIRKIEVELDDAERATVRWRLIVITAERQAMDAGAFDDAPATYVREGDRWRNDTC